jgi:hypothetical protein
MGSNYVRSDMHYTQNTAHDGPATTGGDGPTPSSKTDGSGMGPAVAEKLSETRSAAAGGLDSVASALHRNAETGGDSVKSAGRTAADALSSTANYVRGNDFKGMLADVKKIVKNNPGAALLTAAVLGFVVARTFSRN